MTPSKLYPLLVWGAFVLGALSVYCAVFLYEDEERMIQNKLDEAWKKINEYEKRLMSRHLRFMQVTANLTSELLTRVFGHRAFSLRAFGVSLFFSFASTILVLFILDSSPGWEDVFYFILFVFLGVLAASRKETELLPSIIYMLMLLFLVLEPVVSGDPEAAESAGVLVGIILGVFSDLSYVALFRRSIHRLSAGSSFWKVLFTAIGISLSGILLALVPFTIGRAELLRHGTGFVVNSVFVLGLSNFLIVFTSTLYFVLSFVLLVHRLSWPFFKRPLYASARFGIFRHRKTLLAFGLALMCLKAPQLLNWVIEFLDCCVAL